MFHSEDFEIIDFHVHPFERKENYVAPFKTAMSMDEFDCKMRSSGVDFYAGNVIGTLRDFAAVRDLNRTALRLRDRYANYIPGIHVHGDFPEESCAELHEMKSHGVKLIGELVPSLGGGAFNTAGMLTIFREAAKLNMPVSLHNVTPEEAEFLAANLPELTIVFAHPGDYYGDWGSVARMKFISQHPNMYMDLSGTGLFRWGFLRHFIDLYGAEKLLFGSDMPCCNIGMYVNGVLTEDLTEDELRLVFSGNARRILGM